MYHVVDVQMFVRTAARDARVRQDGGQDGDGDVTG